MGIHGQSIMCRDSVDPLTVIEMGLENLHAFPRNHRAAYSSNELLALAGEHDAADDFDPPGTRAVQHDSRNLVTAGDVRAG